MVSTLTQSFDGAGRTGESNSGAGGGACWLRKLLRRGYDAVPVEDLRFDDVAGIETHWALGQDDERVGAGGGAHQHGALVRERRHLKTLGRERQAGQDDVVVAGLRFHVAGECGAHHGERDRAAPGHAQQCRTHKSVKAHERGSGIAGQHADRHGVPRREADRLSRAHGDAAEAELRSQLGKRSLHQIALAHRRPAGGNEQIGRVARRLQQSPHRLAVIRRGAAVSRLGAALCDQRRKRERVAVANLAVAGDSSDVHQLVSRAHNTDARPAVNTHLGAANKCQQRQRRWAKDFSTLYENVAASNILSRRKDAAAGMRRGGNHDVVVRALQLLEGDYRVGAARDWRSGCDGHRCASGQEGFACFREDFADNRKPYGVGRRGAGDVDGAQRVPVHGRARVGHQVCVGNNVLSDDTSQRLGQRNRLRRQGLHSGQNDFPRLVKSDHTNGCRARPRARYYNPLRSRGLCVDRWMGYGGSLAPCKTRSELPRSRRPKLEQPAGCWRYKNSGSELPRSRRPKLEQPAGCWRYKTGGRELPRSRRPKLEQPAGCWRYKNSGRKVPRPRRPKLEQPAGCWRYKTGGSELPRSRCPKLEQPAGCWRYKKSGSELPRSWRPKLERPAGRWRYKNSGSKLPRSRRPKLERPAGRWRYKSSAHAKGLEHHAFRNTQALWRRGRKGALACPSPS